MESDTHSSISVADYILGKGKESGIKFTPMQIIKLVYLSHGWMLGLFQRPLIDENVEAWRYGPVISTLYHKVKRYRSSPIVDSLSVGQESFDDDERNIMDQVVSLYKGYSGTALSQLTHAVGTPWSMIWEKYGQNQKIPNDIIKEHFSSLAQARASVQNN